MNNIVRKIRMSKIGCYNIKESEKELFEFIDNNLLNLKIKFMIDWHPNYNLYFNSADENILQHNHMNGNLFVSNKLIWSVFETKFNYSYKEISDLIANIVEYAYKLKDISPENDFF